MRSLTISAFFLGLANAQRCPGICINDGEQLLNPTEPIFLNSGTQFCATLNDISRQIVNNAVQCEDSAIQAIALGCECGVPPTPTLAPSPAPVVPDLPTLAPVVPGQEPCLGICPGGTLLNPNRIITIPGQTADFCFVIDGQLQEIVGNPTQCNTLSTSARISGCQCEGVPTATPSMNPTRTRSPTPRPSVNPTGTPTGSAAPTRSASPTKVPTTPDPTGSPTTPKPTAAPGPCSGVCYDASLTVADPDFIIVVPNANGNGIITETCGEADARYRQIVAPGGVCETFSRSAQNNGCSCVAPVECPGICNSGLVTPKSGQQIVTPDLLVNIDGRQDTCANWDARWDGTTSPVLCESVPSKISQALSAGCKCDVPVDCEGLCPGEQVTTPNVVVSLSNGVEAPCSQLDAEFDATIDPGRCNEYTPFKAEMLNNGCRCGTPIDCDGLCPALNEELLTPDLLVDLPAGTSATCSSLDLLARQLIDEGLCTDSINEALAAGCRCGEPKKCDGICPNKDRKLFDKKFEITVPWTGELEECDKVEKEMKDTIIDEIVCLERREGAIQAGCQCGETTESPSMMPSISAAPSRAASSNPTGVPTGTPPTVAPNTPLQNEPTVTGGEPTIDGGDEPTTNDRSPGELNSASGNNKQYLMMTVVTMVAAVGVALGL
ncbi:unnamed protein product [Cylindrotheca closterium]|uniref:Uncharacterized protein n=1 Tax=Cylindrotheca closterium TaxID=2856 RepID=A0AAD2FP61_9STRA|nr:unnamed protein product [Cylindrotheca closterium]